MLKGLFNTFVFSVGQGEPLDLRGERLGERTVSAPLLPIRNEMKEVRPLVGSTGSQD